VVGYAAVGNGSNTTTLGNMSITDTYLQGNIHNSTVLVIPSTATGYTGTTIGKISLVPGTEAFGYATLSSGTVTVSNAAACTPSATCVYKLTNCGTNSSTAIGTLSVGTVVAGTSFVINSETLLAALAIDNSTICWQIN
jgi:hypothetical protein